MLSLAFCGGCTGPVAPAPPRVEAAPSVRDTEPRGDGSVTLEKYNRLTDGMWDADVAHLIGREGEELSSSGTGTDATTVLVWRAAEGGTLTAAFQNFRLVSKSQVGLK